MFLLSGILYANSSSIYGPFNFTVEGNTASVTPNSLMLKSGFKTARSLGNFTLNLSLPIKLGSTTNSDFVFYVFIVLSQSRPTAS